jgi:hypothetical protein
MGGIWDRFTDFVEDKIIEPVVDVVLDALAAVIPGSVVVDGGIFIPLVGFIPGGVPVPGGIYVPDVGFISYADLLLTGQPLPPIPGLTPTIPGSEPEVPVTVEEARAYLSSLTGTEVTTEQAEFFLKIYGGPEGARVTTEEFLNAMIADGVLVVTAAEGGPGYTLDYGAIDGQLLADAIYAAGWTGTGPAGELTEAELAKGLGILIGDPSAVPEGFAHDIVEFAGAGGIVTTGELAAFLNTGAVGFGAVEGQGAVAVTATGQDATGVTFNYAGRTIEVSHNRFIPVAAFTPEELALLDGLDWQAFAATLEPGDDAATIATKFKAFLGDTPGGVDADALVAKLTTLDISATRSDGGVVAEGGDAGILGFLLGDTSTTRSGLSADDRADVLTDLFSVLSTGTPPAHGKKAFTITAADGTTTTVYTGTEAAAVQMATDQAVSGILSSARERGWTGRPMVSVDRNDDGSYSVIVRDADSGIVLGAADFSVSEPGRRHLVEVEVDGTVGGATPEEVSDDAQAEGVFALGYSLVDLTGGLVPAEWGREEYIAFVFGLNGLGDLVGTAEWDQFVAVNLNGADGPRDPADMDFSMFDKFLQDGSDGLETLVGDGLALHDTFKAMEAQGATTFSHDTFEAAYETVLLPDRRHLVEAGMTYRGAPKLRVPSFSQSEASNTVRFGTKAVQAGRVGTAAGEGTAVGTGETVAAGGAADFAGPVGIVVAVVEFADWFANKFLALDNTETHQTIHPEHKDNYRAAYVSETIRTLLHSGDVAGAVDFLLQQEAQGVHVSVLIAALDGLPPAARDAVLADLTGRVGGIDYFTALQNGRDYSALEDKAFELDPNLTSALEGLLAPPAGASSTTQITGVGIGQRLASLPKDTAAKLLLLWSRQLYNTKGADYFKFEQALSTLKTEAPDTFASAASALFDASPDLFAHMLIRLNSNGRSDLAADMIEVLAPPDQVIALALGSGVGGYADLHGILKRKGGGILGEIVAAMSPEAQNALAAYLEGSLLARDHRAAFLALTTPEERAAYLENLTPSGSLLEGATPEATKIAAQAILLSKLPPEEAAEIFVASFYPEGGGVVIADPAAALADLFKYQGPEKSGRLFAELNLQLVRRGKPKITFAEGEGSPIKTTTAEYLENLSAKHDAEFLAGLSPEDAARYLASIDPGQAAHILEAMVKAGNTDHAAAIVKSLAETSPETAANIVQRLSFDVAASVLERLDPAVAKSILDEMLDQIAAAILSEMSSPVVVNIFAETKEGEDYARMLGILLLMGNDDGADAAAQAGIPGGGDEDSIGTISLPNDDALLPEDAAIDNRPASLVLNGNSRIYGNAIERNGSYFFVVEVQNPQSDDIIQAGRNMLAVGTYQGQEVLVPVSEDGSVVEGYIVRRNTMSGAYEAVRTPMGFVPELIDPGAFQNRFQFGEAGATPEQFRAADDERLIASAGGADLASAEMDLLYEQAPLDTDPMDVENAGPNLVAEIWRNLEAWQRGGRVPTREEFAVLVRMLGRLNADEREQISSEQRVEIADWAHALGVDLPIPVLSLVGTRPRDILLEQQEFLGNDRITAFVRAQIDAAVAAVAEYLPDLLTHPLTPEDLPVVATELAVIFAGVYGIQVPQIEFVDYLPDNVAGQSYPATASSPGGILINANQIQNIIRDPSLLAQIVFHEVTHVYQSYLISEIDSLPVESAESELAALLLTTRQFNIQVPGSQNDQYDYTWTESHAWFADGEFRQDLLHNQMLHQNIPDSDTEDEEEDPAPDPDNPVATMPPGGGNP